MRLTLDAALSFGERVFAARVGVREDFSRVGKLAWIVGQTLTVILDAPLDDGREAPAQLDIR